MNNEKIGKVRLKKLASTLKPARPGWRDYANCVGVSVDEVVYPSEEPSRKVRQKLEKLCSDCPVILTCRLEGIRQMEEGWWGGLTQRERMDWAAENLFAEEVTDL